MAFAIPEKYGTSYKNMFEKIQTAAGQMRGTATAPVASEYDRLVEMFGAGGTYGAGQRALIEEEQRKGLSQAMFNLARTGMSSGTNAAGAIQRASRYATTAKLGVEDERTRLLADAMAAAAQAKEARANRITGAYGDYAAILAQMAGMQPAYQNVQNQRYAAGMNAAAQVASAKVRYG